MNDYFAILRVTQRDGLLNLYEQLTGVRQFPNDGVDREAHILHLTEWLYVLQLWAGMPDAVAYFEHYHEPRLRHWLQKYGVPPGEIDDAFCELRERLFPVKVKITGGMMDYDWQGTIDSFLHACARQFAQHWIRNARTHGVPGIDPRRVTLDCDREDNPSRDGVDSTIRVDRADQSEAAADFIDLGEQTAQRLDVEWVLKRLPAQAQEIVKLRYFEEYSEQEIAQKLGMTVFAVKKALARARPTLRKLLADYDPNQR